MDETISHSPKKTNIQFGILFGVIMVLEFVVTYVIGLEKLTDSSASTIMSVFNYVIFPVLFIYLGCNSYKTANHGYITFSECLKMGVSITVIAALIYAVFYIVFSLIFPDFTDQVLAMSRSQMLKSNPDMTSEQLEMGMSMAKKFTSPYIIAPITMVMYAFIGLIYSLIIGAIIKKDKPVSF
ncbi:MAG TPA: DUF4199 domain-containing protein [Flavobacterium sp.]|nr:DUF4199 domain-containing protein [Flavobacterium sp.]